jgi:hypothetical protein
VNGFYRFSKNTHVSNFMKICAFRTVFLSRGCTDGQTETNKHEEFFFIFIFIVAPCILKFHLLSHTNKCTNYNIYYLKSVLIIDIKQFHSSYMFRHITCHPQGTLKFLAKNTGKTICKTWTYIVWRVWQHIMCAVCATVPDRHSSTHCTHAHENSWYAATPFTKYMFMFYQWF